MRLLRKLEPWSLRLWVVFSVTLDTSAQDLVKVIAAVRNWLTGSPGPVRTVRLELAGDVLELSQGCTASGTASLSSPPIGMPHREAPHGRTRQGLILVVDQHEQSGLRPARSPATDAEALGLVLDDRPSSTRCARREDGRIIRDVRERTTGGSVAVFERISAGRWTWGEESGEPAGKGHRCHP